MNSHLFPSEKSRVDGRLLDSAGRSMLDGYLAATASGPNFPMQDLVLMRLSHAGYDIGPELSRWIVRRYVKVNAALNDQTYVPALDSAQAWCRGYLAGFGDDMLAWAPILAARPQLLATVRSGADSLPNAGDCSSLADTVRSVHAFWAAWRMNSIGLTDFAALLHGFLPSTSVRNGYCH